MGSDERQDTIGRPPGKAHELSMFAFWVLYCEQLPEAGTVREAYEAAEVIVLQEYGRRRFRSYLTFRSAKCRFLKTKRKL